MVLHGVGMGANIQATPALQSTFGSGLKTPTQVATDALGNVYIADPGQGKVLDVCARFHKHPLLPSPSVPD